MSVAPEPRPALGQCHPELARLLRAEVWRLRGRTRRRLFATTARVLLLAADGSPAGPLGADLLATTDSAPDHALRVDIAVGGLDAAFTRPAATPARPWVGPAHGSNDAERAGPGRTSAALVVVRPGPLEVVEDDRRWCRAWQVGCDIVGAACGQVYPVTRAGWLDLVALVAVPVPRLRRATGAPPPASAPRRADKSS